MIDCGLGLDTEDPDVEDPSDLVDDLNQEGPLETNSKDCQSSHQTNRICLNAYILTNNAKAHQGEDHKINPRKRVELLSGHMAQLNRNSLVNHHKRQ